MMLHKIKLSNKKSFADWVGIISSMACAMHCLFFPILIIYLSWLGNLHVMLEIAFIGIAFLAVLFASKNMSKSLKRWLWLSFVVFSAALLLHEISPTFQYLSFAGSMGLIICHGQNLVQKKAAPVLAKARS